MRWSVGGRVGCMEERQAGCPPAETGWKPILRRRNGWREDEKKCVINIGLLHKGGTVTGDFEELLKFFSGRGDEDEVERWGKGGMY